MTTVPAGEQHTGTLNLTGEGNEAKGSGISDETVEAALQAWGEADWARSIAQFPDRHACMRAALEAAAPAIRQQVAEQIAATIEARRDADDSTQEFRKGLGLAARYARTIGGTA